MCVGRVALCVNLVERFNAGECSVMLHRTGAQIMEYAPFAPGDLLEVPDPQAFKTAYWRGVASSLLTFLSMISAHPERNPEWMAGKLWLKLEHNQYTLRRTDGDSVVDSGPSPYL